MILAPGVIQLTLLDGATVDRQIRQLSRDPRYSTVLTVRPGVATRSTGASDGPQLINKDLAQPAAQPPAQLMATSVIQGPGHNFASEDPTIFLEDQNITTGERVTRPRQYPQVLLPSAPTLGTEQVGSLSMQDIQRLHQTTGEI